MVKNKGVEGNTYPSCTDHELADEDIRKVNGNCYEML